MAYVFFKRTDLRPAGFDVEGTTLSTVVNAASIATGESWQNVVRCLIEQAHIRANMPTYNVCITDMLKALGFRRLDMQVWTDEVCEKLGEYTSRGSRFVVRIMGRGYFALVPDGDSYVIRGFSGENERALQRMHEVWLLMPGSDNRSGIVKKGERRKLVDSDAGLNVKNLNPEGKCIPDCVPRGLAAAYGCSWHEAVDHLARSVNYTNPHINSISVINQTLTMLGFEHHRRILQDRRLLDGKQFCELMSRRYKNGETMFLFVGTTHCAAALPFTDEKGNISYKIQDTWDSTKRKIHDYWVYSEKKEEKGQGYDKAINHIEVGYLIRHPYFGKGRVTAVSGDKSVEVLFEKQGRKTFSRQWLMEKCGIVEV